MTIHDALFYIGALIIATGLAAFDWRVAVLFVGVVFIVVALISAYVKACKDDEGPQ